MEEGLFINRNDNNYQFSRCCVVVRTFPPLNILLYNAISGNGDELYGIEPASYYVKNLLLTIGLSFPLALLEIGLFTLDVFYHTLASRENLDSSRMLTEFGVCMCAVLWAGVLFSRPHKVAKAAIFYVFQND